MMKHLVNKKTTLLFLSSTFLVSALFYACKKKDKEDEMEDHVHKTANAKIDNVYNDTLVSGTASFSQMNDGNVTLTLDITVPSRAKKSVAVHLHMMGDCGGNAGNAMGHWNPTNSQHGEFGSSAFHLGDIGNIKLDDKGHVTYIITTDAWNINGTDAARNVVGKSIIIHSGVDDYTSQPSGNSGNRIGCGTIQ